LFSVLFNVLLKGKIIQPLLNLSYLYSFVLNVIVRQTEYILSQRRLIEDNNIS